MNENERKIVPRFDTIKDLIAKQTQVYDDLVNGNLDVKIAKEANNSMGKILNGIKVRLEIDTLSKTPVAQFKKHEDF